MTIAAVARDVKQLNKQIYVIYFNILIKKLINQILTLAVDWGKASIQTKFKIS